MPPPGKARRVLMTHLQRHHGQAAPLHIPTLAPGKPAPRTRKGRRLWSRPRACCLCLACGRVVNLSGPPSLLGTDRQRKPRQKAVLGPGTHGRVPCLPLLHRRCSVPAASHRKERLSAEQCPRGTPVLPHLRIARPEVGSQHPLPQRGRQSSEDDPSRPCRGAGEKDRLSLC